MRLARITVDLLLPDDFDGCDLTDLVVECVDLEGHPDSLEDVIASKVVPARFVVCEPTREEPS